MSLKLRISSKYVKTTWPITNLDSNLRIFALKINFSLKNRPKNHIEASKNTKTHCNLHIGEI